MKLSIMSNSSIHMIRTPCIWPKIIMVDYVFACDPVFCTLVWGQKATNLGQAFSVARRVQKFLEVTKQLQQIFVVVEEYDDGNLEYYQTWNDN